VSSVDYPESVWTRPKEKKKRERGRADASTDEKKREKGSGKEHRALPHALPERRGGKKEGALVLVAALLGKKKKRSREVSISYWGGEGKGALLSSAGKERKGKNRKERWMMKIFHLCRRNKEKKKKKGGRSLCYIWRGEREEFNKGKYFNLGRKRKKKKKEEPRAC